MGCSQFRGHLLILNLLTSTIVAPPSKASKWQMGFNSAFKGFNYTVPHARRGYSLNIIVGGR